MFSPGTKKLPDCGVMPHDRMKLGYMEMSYEKVIEILIRKSLQIPSTSRVKQYY